MTIIPYIFNPNDTLEIIKKKYQLDDNDIYNLNPLFRNKPPHPGQIVYIKQEVFEVDEDKLINQISIINKISKDKYVSYYLKHNDHSLLDAELNEQIHKLSFIIFKDDNNQKLLESHILLIKNNLISFFDFLAKKDENNLTESKKEMNNNISNLINFLHINKINIEHEKITKLISTHLKMFLYILEENYYDLKLLEM